MMEQCVPYTHDPILGREHITFTGQPWFNIVKGTLSFVYSRDRVLTYYILVFDTLIKLIILSYDVGPKCDKACY